MHSAKLLGLWKLSCNLTLNKKCMYVLENDLLMQVFVFYKVANTGLPYSKFAVSPDKFLLESVDQVVIQG